MSDRKLLDPATYVYVTPHNFVARLDLTVTCGLNVQAPWMHTATISEDTSSHFHIHRWNSLSLFTGSLLTGSQYEIIPSTQTTLLLLKRISSTHISYFPHFNLMFRISCIYPTSVTFLISRLLLPFLFILFPSRKWRLDVVNTTRRNKDTEF